MTKLWLSCERWTCQADVQDGRIVWTAPILRKFVGQSVGHIGRWCASKGWKLVRLVL